VRLAHRIMALFGGRRAPNLPVAALRGPSPSDRVAVGARPAPDSGLPAPGGPGASTGGPGAATADPADPCGPARTAVQEACSLADRMNALAHASAERLQDARRAYDEHAGRRERAVAAADPRAVRAAKDEAQAAFRTARLGARERGALETAAREWLREIDRVNARTREAARLMAREDAARGGLLQSVERLGVEADGARIAAESAAEVCLNARIALANCEEADRLGLGRSTTTGTLAPASWVTGGAPVTPTRDPAAATPAMGSDSAAGLSVAAAEPAVLPLLAGDHDVMRRIAATLAEGDAEAEGRWQLRLTALVEAVRGRAIDGAALTFPEDGFWGPYTQVQGREIAAALAALGYRYDGHEGFADGRVPGQRELSLAIGYAGLDPMRIRLWPSEAELPRLFAGVQVDSGHFVAEAAGELTLGDMIDLLGRRAEELSDLWNAWGRVRPLLLSPV